MRLHRNDTKPVWGPQELNTAALAVTNAELQYKNAIYDYLLQKPIWKKYLDIKLHYQFRKLIRIKNKNCIMKTYNLFKFAPLATLLLFSSCGGKRYLRDAGETS